MKQKKGMRKTFFVLVATGLFSCSNPAGEKGSVNTTPEPEPTTHVNAWGQEVPIRYNGPLCPYADGYLAKEVYLFKPLPSSTSQQRSYLTNMSFPGKTGGRTRATFDMQTKYEQNPQHPYCCGLRFPPGEYNDNAHVGYAPRHHKVIATGSLPWDFLAFLETSDWKPEYREPWVEPDYGE